MRRHLSKSPGGIACPSARWINRCHVFSGTRLLSDRTEPSQNATLQYWPFQPKSSGGIFFGLYSMSSGLVQTTALVDSTTKIVFDKPSGKSDAKLSPRS